MTVDPSHIDQIVSALQQHPDYKVLRRLTEQEQFGWVKDASSDHPLRVVVIDTETTGVDFNKDKVIEIGAIAIEVDAATGQLGKVLDRFSALEDPGFPIPPESTAIHGITDEMVSGKRFDEEALYSLVKGAAIVIAHNAGFDRPFLESRFKFFEEVPWGCTFKQINWNEEGYGSSKLEFIVYKLGYFYDAHRAITDCFALMQILASPLPQSGMMPMQLLIQAAEQKEFVIHALNSPFESKDLLKDKGFRWDAEARVWKTTVSGKHAGDELIVWLKKFIYRGADKVRLGFQATNSLDRFSLRQTNYTIKEV